MTTTFTIEHMRWCYDREALVVGVDSAHFGRGYECTWQPECDHFEVRKHWRDDGVERTYVLPMDEAHAVYRFLDANDDVAEAYARLRQEPMPVVAMMEPSVAEAGL